MTDMIQLHSQFWSKIAVKYDPVVDSQIGTNTRAMVRERLAREQNWVRWWNSVAALDFIPKFWPLDQIT